MFKKPIEGYIISRADGRFEGRYTLNNKRLSVYAKSYNECLNKLNEALQVRDNKYTLFFWFSEWLRLYKKDKVSDSWYNALKTALDLHIKPNIKDKLLCYVTALDVQNFFNKLSSTRTKENVYNVFCGAFKKAYALRLIDFNIMLAVDPIKYERVNGKALSSVELSKFIIDIESNSVKDYFLFCLYSGVRRGEGLKLVKKDIDLKKNTIHIRGTKTKTSNRYIPFFDSLKLLLLPYIDRLQDNDKFFNFSADYVTHEFKNICSNHKLHDLRHTFATKCLTLGISMKVVQGWLGHSSIEVTSDIYMHVSEDFGQSEAVKMNTDFSKKV